MGRLLALLLCIGVVASIPAGAEGHVREWGGPGAPFHRAGRVFRILDESGTIERQFGALGEVRREVRTITAVPPGRQSIVLTTRTTYDSFGRLLSLVYPDGEALEHRYDGGGKLASIIGVGANFRTTYVSELRYDVFENRTFARYGNGATSSYRFDPAMVRLETATTTLSSGELIQNLIYGYDEVGNPTRITSEVPTPRPNDSRLPGPGEWTYTYDGVDRLTFASGSMRITSKGERFTQSFAYTPIHNLRQKTREHIVDQPSGTPSRPPQTQVNDLYTYSGKRPHAPTRVGDLDLVYDASGNVIERRKVGTGSVERLTWDDDNRLVEVQQSGTHLRNVYDHEGKRVVKRGRFGETIYASAYFDLESGTHCAKHVFAGPVRVATIMNRFPSSGGGGSTKKDSGAAEDAEPPPPTRAGSAYYYHPDHLGGTTVLTAPDGDIHEHLQYFPDGALWIERGPRRPIDGVRFSGKGFDAETGFYDFGQRFYDPRVSLWLGVDPYVTEGDALKDGRVLAPMDLSVFAYTRLSPGRFVDPDGRNPPVPNMHRPRWEQESPAYAEAARLVDVGSAPATLLGGAIGVGVLAVAPAVTAMAVTSAEKVTAAVAAGAEVVRRQGARLQSWVNAAWNLLPRFGNASRGAIELTRSQARNIRTISNIIKNHAKPSDFNAVAAELRGVRFPKPGGGHWDHVGEMLNSVQGLEKAVQGLKGSLQNPNLNAATRSALEASLRQAQTTIERMNSVLVGR